MGNQIKNIFLVALAMLMVLMAALSLSAEPANHDSRTNRPRHNYFLITRTEWSESAELVELAAQLEPHGTAVVFDTEHIHLTPHSRTLYLSPDAFLLMPSEQLQAYYQKSLFITILDTPASQIAPVLPTMIGFADLRAHSFTDPNVTVVTILNKYVNGNSVFRDFVPTEFLSMTLRGQTVGRTESGDISKSTSWP